MHGACASGELHAATVLGSLQLNDQKLLACVASYGDMFAVSSNTGLVTLMRCELLDEVVRFTKVAEMQMSVISRGDQPILDIVLTTEGHLLAVTCRQQWFCCGCLECEQPNKTSLGEKY